MNLLRPAFLVLAVAAIGHFCVSADAAELRDYCPDRPGLDTPACTIDKGHVDIEIGIADWTGDRRSGVRIDSLSVGETLLRYGVDDSTELQIGWDGFGAQHMGRTDDETIWGSGDARLAVRHNLRNPDGSGLSIAIMPFVTLPVGKTPIGEGDWTGGIIVPLSYELPHGLQLAFTAELDAATDDEKPGHHIAYGGTVGLAVPLGKNLTSTIELQEYRDDDPSAGSEQTLAALSVAWMHGSALQIDAGSVVGVSYDAPNVQFYAGVSRRF